MHVVELSCPWWYENKDFDLCKLGKDTVDFIIYYIIS